MADILLTNNYEFWKQTVEKFIREKPHFRKGQAYFNALALTDSDLPDKWTGSDCDCFFDDSRCEAFEEKVKKAFGDGV